MTDRLQWFLPTFHGDIALEETADGKTSLRVFELTPTEEAALAKLRARALEKAGDGAPWASEKDFPELSTKSYRTKTGITIVLGAPIAEVEGVLSASLKPGTKLLRAARYADGRIEEVKAGSKPTGADKAATVAEPLKGCPAPAFEEAEIRASRVLESFLSPDQLADYRSHGAFLAAGVDTGHRYMITHRERPLMMAHYCQRSLYDIDEDKPLCVHDWTVPAPEEMLALLFCVSIPGKESAVRDLPEVWEH